MSGKRTPSGFDERISGARRWCDGGEEPVINLHVIDAPEGHQYFACPECWGELVLVDVRQIAFSGVPSCAHRGLWCWPDLANRDGWTQMVPVVATVMETPR